MLITIPTEQNSSLTFSNSPYPTNRQTRPMHTQLTPVGAGSLILITIPIKQNSPITINNSLHTTARQTRPICHPASSQNRPHQCDGDSPYPDASAMDWW